MHKGVQLSCMLNKANFQHRSNTPAKFQVSITFCRGARAVKYLKISYIIKIFLSLFPNLEVI